MGAATGVSDSATTVKQECDSNAESGGSSSRKRRRGDLTSVDPCVLTAAALLPDASALANIDMLIDLFGESMQPTINAAVKGVEENVARAIHQAQVQAARSTAPISAIPSSATKFVINRNNISAATAFL